MTQSEMKMMQGLIDVIARLCDEFCKCPEYIPEYCEAIKLLENQDAQNGDA